MKRLLLLLIILFVFAFNDICSASVTVTGITSPTEMNGVYVEMGTYNGRPYYELTDGMSTYSIFWQDNGMDGDWIIYPGEGPYVPMSMWMPFNGHFIFNSMSMTPPISGYSPNPPIMGITVTGSPTVNPPPVPLSIWSIVFLFLASGSFMVYRYYKKRKTIA